MTLPPTSLLVDAAGVHLHALVWDPAPRGPDLPAVLLVHGLASNAQLWTGVGATLAARGHRVVAVDQRGHGLSAKPDDGYDFTTLTADLVAVVEALDLARPVVVGQSWGGNVALELAVRHGERVTAVAGVDGGHIDLAARFEDRASMRASLTPPRLAGTRLVDIEAGLRRRFPHWPETGIRGQLANLRRRPDGTVEPHLSLERHLVILDHLWEHRPADRWAQVGVPALLLPVRGGDPGTRTQAAVAAAQRAQPRLQVTWLEGDHDVHASRPELVARLVQAFVADPEVAPTV